jgi:KDO2-lipid IV(A) lauroyltransferase
MVLSRWLREVQYLLEFLPVWLLVFLVRHLPQPLGQALARWLARLVYLVLRHDRRWAIRNLELVFGDNLTPVQRKDLVRQCFENIVRTRVEMIRWTREWMAVHVIEEGGEQARQAARQAARQGRGVIYITAHLGNFELIPAWGHYTGWESTVLYRPQNNWRVERLLHQARTRYLPGLAPRGALGVLNLMYDLREGRSVGLVIDQNVLEGGVFVDFLGFAASSPPGVAALALATRAPVILSVCLRQPDGRFRLIFHPPFGLIDTGDRQHDLVANTQQYHQAIEAFVLAYPEQYNWPHPRWRKRPDGSLWSLAWSAAEMAGERSGPPRRPGREMTSRPRPKPAVQEAA